MKKSILIGSICAILLVLTTYGVYAGFFESLDSSVYAFVLNIRSESLTTLFKMITLLGGPIVLIAIPVILMIFRSTRRTGIIASLALFVSYLTNNLLKVFVKRPRMDFLALVNEKSYSFPSGHSMNSLVLYGTLILLALCFTQKSKNKKIASIVLSIFVLSIGFSRIYLGAHYTSDVIGGFLAGGVVLSAAHLVIEYFAKDHRI